jgi:hypothetical protein
LEGAIVEGDEEAGVLRDGGCCDKRKEKSDDEGIDMHWD